MNKLAIQSAEEWMQTQQGGRILRNSSPTPISSIVESPAQSLTTSDVLVRILVVLITIAALLLICYLLIKIIFPKTARYFGYLIWEFKKGREGKT